MEHPEITAKMGRAYGRVIELYTLVRKKIEPGENAERCLMALENYENTVSEEVRREYGLNVSYLRERCLEVMEQSLSGRKNLPNGMITGLSGALGQ